MLFAIERKDGCVSIMKLIDGDNPHSEIAKWNANDQAEVVSVHPIEETDIPADRTFRGAWKLNAGKVVVDMPKARDLHRSKLRGLRTPVLSSLDVEYQKADETGDSKKKKDIAKRKQALRDVTTHPAIDAAKTPDELKAVIPDVLKV